MKAVIEMDIVEIKDVINNKMVKITDDFLNDKRFNKAMAKHTEKICKQLEKFYKKHHIHLNINYHFAKKNG